MEALQFVFNPALYVLAKAAGAVHPAAFASRIGLLRYGDVPEPKLPGPEWVKIDTIMGGICGSDLSLIALEDSPSLSPLASFPFVVGHENVGVVRETGAAVTEVQPGQRVVADPLLPCAVRGFKDLCPACAAGRPNRCLRFTEGDIAPGLLLGHCRDTGGSWGATYVAHRSQLIPVPDHVSNENALMAEPFGCALHAVALADVAPGSTVLVIGGGVIGLSVVAALKVLAPHARVIALVRHAFQAERAKKYGAHGVLRPRRGEQYREVAEALGAKLLKPVLGAPVLVGGADVVFECAGSPGALNDALRFARPGGKVVLVGLASFPRGIDWSFIWQRELQIQGVFASGPIDTPLGRMTAMQYAMRLFADGTVDLSDMVTHRFALKDYRQALATAWSKKTSGCLKAVLIPDTAVARAWTGGRREPAPVTEVTAAAGRDMV
ncbi:MAG: alcohol dehydrogenase catalytic domain-containing protein [Limnochordales bacterium]|nr:alcohol dehydrogenase [Bacillota bacterium]